jgi:cytochrome c-type biogenesis CcmH protein
MEQLSAILRQYLAKDSNASSRVATRVRKLWLLLAILTMPMLSTADDHTSDSRYKDLGHRVICTCDKQAPTGMGAKGCRQALLECDHLDCPTSKRMRQELKAAMQNGDTDDMILNSFVQKYGASVLQVPRDMNNRLVWIFALAILVTTCTIMVVFLRKQRSRVAMLTTTATEPQNIKVKALRHVREERKEEDERRHES